MLAVVAGTGHTVYPVWLHLRTRKLSDEVAPVPQGWAPLTVVVPAYLEQSVIAAKVADVRANGYPGALEVVVVADDDATAAAATTTGATLVHTGQRVGKAEALNRGVAAAGSDLVILTDANTVLAPGSLAAMARWFEDPSVGAVAGEKTVTAGGEGVYWRFESWLKQRESRTGTTIGLVGELVAIRRKVFRPLPADLAAEDLWMALDVLEQGLRVVYEPAACSREEPNPGWRDAWERRTAVVCGVIDVCWRRRRLLVPGRGMVAVQLWGHRLVRCSLGPMAHLMLVVVAAQSCRRSRLGALTVGAHAIGAVAVVQTQRRARQSAMGRLAGQALFLQAVGLGGLVRYLVGERPSLWPKQVRSAPRSASVSR